MIPHGLRADWHPDVGNARARRVAKVQELSHGKLCCRRCLPLRVELPNGAAAADVKRLGCYFCNDCVAPRNSQSNRTLDQRKLTKALYSIPATELS